MYQDGSQNNSWRFLAVNSQNDTDYIVTDLWSTSCYEKPYIHWDFNRDRVSVGDFLTEAAKSLFCYLRLNSPDACNSADDVRIVGRWHWTPPSIGTLDKAAVHVQPKVIGVEYYEGATASINGLIINATGQTTTVGKTVLQFSGAFLTPGRAQLIADWVVAYYSRHSAALPFGRRIFAPEALHESDIAPVQSDLFKLAAISFLTGLSTYGLITSVGLERAPLLYPCRLLEFAASVVEGKLVGYGVVWTQDEPASNVTLPAYSEAIA